MSRDEIERQQRVPDQMLTMYSLLRDRYARRSICLTLGILASSVVLVACTFLPETALAMVNISPFATKVVLGVFSSLILFLSIADLRVDWKERSRQYGEAADRLASVKLRFRVALSGTQSLPDPTGAELMREYNDAIKGLPRIPDRQFLKLKAYHLRKVRLSQMIDGAVGCPIWVLRLRLLKHGCQPEATKKVGEIHERIGE